MHPVSFSYSGTVGAPIDRVFDLITDPTRMPEWLPQCRAVIPAREPQRKGVRHRIQFERDRRRIDAEIEVIDYHPPTSYAWVEIYRRAGSKTFFALHFQGGATRVTMKYVWVPAGLRSWMLGQFFRRRNAHRMFDGLLQNLRKVLTRER